MKISANGANFIKSFEGLALKAYRDSAGVLTIGYGHTSEAGLPKVYPNMTMTKKEADLLFLNDIKKYEKCVTNNVKVNLNQNQFDAMVSFCYNVGCEKFIKSSVLKNLNKGEFSKVPDSLMLYVYSNKKKLNGLIKRRSAEVELFLRDVPNSSVEASKKFYVPFKEIFALIASIPATVADNRYLFLATILIIVAVIFFNRRK